LISQNNSPSLNAMRLRIHLLFFFGHIFLSLKSPSKELCKNRRFSAIFGDF